MHKDAISNSKAPLVVWLTFLAAAASPAVLAENANTGQVFLFQPSKAQWGDTVTVRSTSSSATSSPRRQVELRRRSIRLYLVSAADAPNIRSRYDDRLNFVGVLVLDKRGRGNLKFTLPPLKSQMYLLATWCSGCGGLSVQRLPRTAAPHYRRAMELSVHAPPTDPCPVTIPNGNRPSGEPAERGPFAFHGNGSLWALLRPDGSLITNHLGGYKMFWWAMQGLSGHLNVRYRLLSPPAATLMARSGRFAGDAGPSSAASQMSFSPGCWQITGRVLDVSLTFVVNVVRGSF
jgi:hypothetical protein